MEKNSVTARITRGTNYGRFIHQNARCLKHSISSTVHQNQSKLGFLIERPSVYTNPKIAQYAFWRCTAIKNNCVFLLLLLLLLHPLNNKKSESVDVYFAFGKMIIYILNELWPCIDPGPNDTKTRFGLILAELCCALNSTRVLAWKTAIILRHNSAPFALFISP